MAKGNEEVIHKSKLDKKDQLHAPLGERDQWVCNVASGGHVTGSCWNLRACLSHLKASLTEALLKEKWTEGLAQLSSSFIFFSFSIFMPAVCGVWVHVRAEAWGGHQDWFWITLLPYSPRLSQSNPELIYAAILLTSLLSIPPLCLLRLEYRYIYTYLFRALLTALLPHQHPQLHGLSQSLKRYLEEIL